MTDIFRSQYYKTESKLMKIIANNVDKVAAKIIKKDNKTEK